MLIRILGGLRRCLNSQIEVHENRQGEAESKTSENLLFLIKEEKWKDRRGIHASFSNVGLMLTLCL